MERAMNGKERFSSQEWDVVSALPSQAAIAAAVSDGITVIGTIRELNEGVDALNEGVTTYPDNELIAAILNDLVEQAREEEEAERMIAEGGTPPPAEDDVDDLPPEAIEPAAETPPDFTEEVETSASPADAVAAVEIPEVDPRDPGVFVHEVVANAMQVREILASKSTPDETAGYRAWVLGIVERVINRTKSGGFLGIGGERIGAEEAAFRDDLAAALGP
jgi:hypothetical protein